MPTLQTVVPEELVGAVDRYAEETGQSRSAAAGELLKMALRSLDRWPPKTKGGDS